jgi:hypothetical protein
MVVLRTKDRALWSITIAKFADDLDLMDALFYAAPTCRRKTSWAREQRSRGHRGPWLRAVVQGLEQAAPACGRVAGQASPWENGKRSAARAALRRPQRHDLHRHRQSQIES